MTNIIRIEGVRLFAYHGCLEEEARIGGEYLVDVVLETDFSQAAKSDELEQTVDYCSVYEICKAEMAIRSKLIEHVCRRIHQKILREFPQIYSASVRVTKLSPPMNGDVGRVSVEIKG